MIEKSSISLFSTMPVPGTVMSEPNSVFTVCVSDTALPCASTTEICVVPASVGGAIASGARAFGTPGLPQFQGARIAERRRAAARARARRRTPSRSACRSARSSSRGRRDTAARSANASFIAPATRLISSLELSPSVAQVVRLERVQHLDQQHAARARRRHRDELEPAVLRRAPACARSGGSRRGRRAVSAPPLASAIARASGPCESAVPPARRPARASSRARAAAAASRAAASSRGRAGCARSRDSSRASARSICSMRRCAGPTSTPSRHSRIAGFTSSFHSSEP